MDLINADEYHEPNQAKDTRVCSALLSLSTVCRLPAGRIDVPDVARTRLTHTRGAALRARVMETHPSQLCSKSAAADFLFHVPVRYLAYAARSVFLSRA